MAALRLWQARVDAELIAQGFAFMAGAQGQLLYLIDPGGTPEAKLTDQTALESPIADSIDALIRSGALIREPDENATLRLSDLGQRGLRAHRAATEHADEDLRANLPEGHAQNYFDLIGLLQDPTKT